MGSSPPGTIEDGKVYMVHTQGYSPIPPGLGCAGLRLDDRTCCVGSAVLKAHTQGDFDCEGGHPTLCPIGGEQINRLLWIIGPYDDGAACVAKL